MVRHFEEVGLFGRRSKLQYVSTVDAVDLARRYRRRADETDDGFSIEEVASGMHGRDANFVSSTKVGLTLNAKLVVAGGNSSGSNSETVTLLLLLARFFGVFRFAGKGHDSLGCDVSGFVAADLIGLFSALLRTVCRASVAYCTCFERVCISRFCVHRPPLYSFSNIKWRCVLIERHMCNGRMKKACRVHNL